MKLTKRGEKVVGIASVFAMLSIILIAGRMDADYQCKKFEASNNHIAALEAGCSFDALPNGEYPYTWQP